MCYACTRLCPIHGISAGEIQDQHAISTMQVCYFNKDTTAEHMLRYMCKQTEGTYHDHEMSSNHTPCA